MATSRRSLLAAAGLASACAATRDRARESDRTLSPYGSTPSPPPTRVGAAERITLEQPGPMLPPVPAIVTAVAGDDEGPPELAVLWTFVLNGNPPQVGISAQDDHAIGRPLARQKEFTLNVPDRTWLRAFDSLDMSSSRRGDKFGLAGLTPLPSTTIAAPGIAEAAIVLECRVSAAHRLEPQRRVFFADVLRTSVAPGVCDAHGRLEVNSREFFGMTAGSGEFWTLQQSVGHIGMTVGRTDIRY